MKYLLMLCLLGVPVWASLDDAKAHFAEGRFADARAAAAKVGARDPNYARAQYLVGEIALLTGDTDAAVAAFRAARKVKPRAEPVLTGLGRALLAADEAEEALEVLEKAVAANPHSGRALAFFGIAQRRDTLGRRGAKSIRKGAKLGAADPVVARAVVLYWLDEDDVAKATAAADRFRRANKKHPMGSFLKALSLERAKKYDDAIEAYQKALSLDPKFLDAHKNLAILCIAQNPLYRDRKRTDLAAKHLKEYFALGGKDPEVKRIHETLKQVLAQFK